MNPDLVLNLTSVAILILLLLLGTYLSATEMAFASLNRARIKNIAEGGGKRGKRAAKVFSLYENRFDEVISTLLICNNIVAITSATVSVVLFVRLIGDEWGYIVSTVVISSIVIVLTDIFPKSISKEKPETVAIFAVPFLRLLMALLKPITMGVVKMKNGLSSKFMRKEETLSEDEQNLRGQELIFMVEEAEKDGAINEDDSLLITNAIEFNDLLAEDILTPRVNVVSIPMGASMDEIAKLFLTGYSRMPVYEDSMDTIHGIVHIRDFLKCVVKNGDGPASTLQDIITPAIFTVKGARVSELLKLLKKEKSHMAIVTDEYGGTEGIITMEDILERLVGEIWDENDEVIEEILPLDENKFKVLCTANIDTMFEHFSINAESQSNTVCGWIMDMLRRTPEEGDSFDYEKLKVTVTKADGRRAEECLVELIPGDEPPAETEPD